MEINTIIHGFKVTNVRHFDEIEADMYEMIHLRTQAKTIWLKRNDENKTFSIAFKTTPVDDTGVFHILEHSVLNGSKKYPVREPFVDLLKGSLQTFLNAMTYPDKTVYPVSSRNDKDFVNLMRVYLDAVFDPLVLSNPNIFYQEGWHYEMNDVDTKPIYKGVVFNEMKGAFSSADGVRSRLMMHSLFPDTCYGNESGGDPENITDLSYEQFCATHRKHYNPSNSYIFLDGDMDIETILGIIDDEYLSRYNSEGDKIIIGKQSPVIDEVTKEYEISPSEDPAGKAQISYGYVIGDFDEYKKIIAFSLISSVLSSSNESPLKKAILSKGLGEDVSFYVQDGILQPFVSIDIQNCDLQNKEEIENAIREVFENAVKEKVDRKELEAALNQREFKAKERDFGGMPKGLVFALSSLDSWLYDGDPADSICYNDLFTQLRNDLQTSYYEDLIDEFLLHSKHFAKIFLAPSNTLGQEKIEKEKAKLASLYDKWTKEEKENYVRISKDLIEWQSKEDTPEQKATLPALHLDDLKKTPTLYPLEKRTYEDTKVLYHPAATNGISYDTLIINCDDLNEEEITLAAQLTTLLSNLKTENYDVLSLNREIKSILGDISASFTGTRTFKDRKVKKYLLLTWSSLYRNDEKAIELIKEIIYRTDYSDAQAIRNILKQNIFSLEQAFINAGHSLAVMRASAYVSSVSAAAEYAKGYEAYRYLKQLDAEWDKRCASFIDSLKKLSEKIFVRQRYTLSVSGQQADENVRLFMKDAPEGKIGETHIVAPLGNRNEGIAVPANVSFAAKYAQLDDKIKNIGVMLVLSNILTYDYLWNNIRVKGGAYGCGFRSGTGRSIGLYSYRDPDPANSLRIYEETKDYLKGFVERNNDIENYIVGTTGDFDPLLSVKTAIAISDGEYLMDYDYEDKCAILDQILHCNVKDIEDTIKLFDYVNEDNNVCVIGNRTAIEKCGDKLKKIFDLNSAE